MEQESSTLFSQMFISDTCLAGNKKLEQRIHESKLAGETGISLAKNEIKLFKQCNKLLESVFENSYEINIVLKQMAELQNIIDAQILPFIKTIKDPATMDSIQEFANSIKKEFTDSLKLDQHLNFLIGEDSPQISYPWNDTYDSKIAIDRYHSLLGMQRPKAGAFQLTQRAHSQMMSSALKTIDNKVSNLDCLKNFAASMKNKNVKKSEMMFILENHNLNFIGSTDKCVATINNKVVHIPHDYMTSDCIDYIRELRHTQIFKLGFSEQAQQKANFDNARMSKDEAVNAVTAIKVDNVQIEIICRSLFKIPDDFYVDYSALAGKQSSKLFCDFTSFKILMLFYFDKIMSKIVDDIGTLTKSKFKRAQLNVVVINCVTDELFQGAKSIKIVELMLPTIGFMMLFSLKCESISLDVSSEQYKIKFAKCVEAMKYLEQSKELLNPKKVFSKLESLDLMADYTIQNEENDNLSKIELDAIDKIANSDSLNMILSKTAQFRSQYGHYLDSITKISEKRDFNTKIFDDFYCQAVFEGLEDYLEIGKDKNDCPLTGVSNQSLSKIKMISINRQNEYKKRLSRHTKKAAEGGVKENKPVTAPPKFETSLKDWAEIYDYRSINNFMIDIIAQKRAKKLESVFRIIVDLFFHKKHTAETQKNALHMISDDPISDIQKFLPIEIYSDDIQHVNEFVVLYSHMLHGDLDIKNLRPLAEKIYGYFKYCERAEEVMLNHGQIKHSILKEVISGIMHWNKSENITGRKFSSEKRYSSQIEKFPSHGNFPSKLFYDVSVITRKHVANLAANYDEKPAPGIFEGFRKEDLNFDTF